MHDVELLDVQSPVGVLLDFIKCSYSSVKVSSRSKFTCTETEVSSPGPPSTLLRASLPCLQEISILAATGWRSFAATEIFDSFVYVPPTEVSIGVSDAIAGAM